MQKMQKGLFSPTIALYLEFDWTTLKKYTQGFIIEARYPKDWSSSP